MSQQAQVCWTIAIIVFGGCMRCKTASEALAILVGTCCAITAIWS